MAAIYTASRNYHVYAGDGNIKIYARDMNNDKPYPILAGEMEDSTVKRWLCELHAAVESAIQAVAAFDANQHAETPDGPPPTWYEDCYPGRTTA